MPPKRTTEAVTQLSEDGPRPAEPRPATAPGELIAALDIGGTKTAAALVDVQGKLVARTTRATMATRDAETVMGAVERALTELVSHPRWSSVRGVGVGSAGPVDANQGTVRPVNIPHWRDFPLVARVTALVDALPVVLTGDGVAMAAAEHWLGAARGFANALCMVVSTGVGGGLVLGGVLHPGPTGNAGHIGHLTVDLDVDPCPCGSQGCVESIASGPNIVRRALSHGWRPERQEVTAEAVAKAAREGDQVALASFDRAAQALAAAIAGTAALTEIEIAVIGGGVSKAGPVLFDPLRRWLRHYATLSHIADLPVCPALMGTDAGLVGAAAAAAQSLGLTAFIPDTGGNGSMTYRS